MIIKVTQISKKKASSEWLIKRDCRFVWWKQIVKRLGSHGDSYMSGC